MIKEGWGFFPHYFKRHGKRFWNNYPPDDGRSREGFYYTYKSLCGKHTFVMRTSNEPPLYDKLQDKRKPCLICLLRLARLKHII